MTPLGLAADTVAALALVAAAVAFLGVRALRTLGGRGGACGCGPTRACGAGGGPTVEDLRRAAARGAARVNRGSAPDAR